MTLMKRMTVIFLALALAMAGLAACAPPTPPPLPTPPAELTVYEAEAEALRALGDPASSALLDQRHAWPLICTTDGDYDPRESNMAHLAAVASHHCTMWTFNWPDYYKNAAATVKNPFTVLRGLNPAIAVIGVTHSYLIPWSACESPAFPATCAIWRAVDGNDWYAYNGDGERIPSATGTWINWTAGYSQWLADFVAGQAARKCDDGKPCYQGFYIEVAGIPHGISNFFTADLDRDGQQDMRPGPGGMTKCELDAKQIKGYTDFAQAVSRSTGLPGGGENFGPGLAGPDSPNPLLGKVTMYFDGEFPFGAWPDCTRDPYGGSGGYTTLGDAWGMHLRSAFAFQDAGVPGVLYRQDDWTLPSSENQTRRLVMATAAMTDMYAVPHESQLPEQMPCDECLVNEAGFTTGDPANLGWAGKPRGEPFRPRDGATMRQAIARGERLSDDVWVRFFDGAFVAVNPTERAQIVNIPAGFAAVNAATRPAGDWAVNNGRPVTRLELAPKDGRILRRLPVPSPTATASPGARPTVTPTMTASPGARPTATPTMTVRPTATPTATATPSELERLKLRVSALETAVAGGR